MSDLIPLIGPGWSDPVGKYVENKDERESRFHRAQAKHLFSWHKCEKCGELFPARVGHKCERTNE